MKTILFQGDSITDWYRSTGPGYGMGYPLLVSAALGYEKPNEYNFINRGIAGNRIVDVYARIEQDIINLKPDYMSILIGVNDAWHNIDWANGVDNEKEKFEKIYSMLIEEIKAELPEIKIMIMEPFCLKGCSTDNTAEIPNKWEIFKSKVEKRSESAKRIAEKYNLTFVPLQQKFDEAVNLAEEKYWLEDGVHPTPMGHEIIKNEWLNAFHNIKK